MYLYIVERKRCKGDRERKERGGGCVEVEFKYSSRRRKNEKKIVMCTHALRTQDDHTVRTLFHIASD